MMRVANFVKDKESFTRFASRGPPGQAGAAGRTSRLQVIREKICNANLPRLVIVQSGNSTGFVPIAADTLAIYSTHRRFSPPLLIAMQFLRRAIKPLRSSCRLRMTTRVNFAAGMHNSFRRRCVLC